MKARNLGGGGYAQSPWLYTCMGKTKMKMCEIRFPLKGEIKDHMAKEPSELLKQFIWYETRIAW